MVIARTKLKKIPEKCLKCKFCIDVGKLGKKHCKNCWDSYRIKRCFLTAAEVPYIYNETKRNWEYTKCKTCPLTEVNEWQKT